MNYVTELSDVLRDSNVSQDDKQAVLSTLHDLATKGDIEARNALESVPLSHLQGGITTWSFSAVFNHCCELGWSEKEFEFWNQWQAAVSRDVFGGLDAMGTAPRPLPPSSVDAGVLYGYCKSRGMSVPECHVFLIKLGEHPTSYDRLAYDTAQCEREGKTIPNFRWYLLKLVWDSEHLPKYDWCSQELVQTTLDKYLPIAELTVPLFKEVAALEHELLTTGIHHNERVSEIKNRPRVRELASWFTSRPDTKVYLPDSVYDLFWQMTKLAS